jgi:hypothetical protein
MQESSKKVVVDILKRLAPTTILDAPSGDGWLAQKLSYPAVIDGIDLFETTLDAAFPRPCPNIKRSSAAKGWSISAIPSFSWNRPRPVWKPRVYSSSPRPTSGIRPRACNI